MDWVSTDHAHLKIQKIDFFILRALLNEGFSLKEVLNITFPCHVSQCNKARGTASVSVEGILSSWMFSEAVSIQLFAIKWWTIEGASWSAGQLKSVLLILKALHPFEAGDVSVPSYCFVPAWSFLQNWKKRSNNDKNELEQGAQASTTMGLASSFVLYLNSKLSSLLCELLSVWRVYMPIWESPRVFRLQFNLYFLCF